MSDVYVPAPLLVVAPPLYDSIVEGRDGRRLTNDLPPSPPNPAPFLEVLQPGNLPGALQFVGVTLMPPQQRTILLVDDDHEILESMRTVLENKGFRILAARDGNAGLMLAERENPDLIVLDMMMPKKSGFLVLEKLKSRPGGLIPTIMITGNEGSRHRAYAEMLGVREYIRKPFAMEKLVRAIERVMGVKSRPDGYGDEEV
jgi:CheY-like chemotaxis protein